MSRPFVHRHPLAPVLCLSILSALLCSSLAGAQPTPVGLWRTIDDNTGKAKSEVRIVDAQGRLSGRIEKLIDPTEADPVCSKCSDDRHNQRVQGMVVLRDLRPSPDRTGVWEGGNILDPEEGKVYRVRLTPSADGRRLEVRGYIGMPLLGRTQYWQRLE